MNTMTAGTELPEQFAELQRFVSKWDKLTMNERYAERLASSMTELQDFHDTVLPLIDDIKEYLDGKPLDNLSPGESSLGRLLFAWVNAAQAVEIFQQPRVPDAKEYWEVPDEPIFL